MLAMTWRRRAEIPQVIGAVREQTARPFGVNLVIERDQDARLDVCLEQGVRIVSFFWGDPARYVERVHQAGGIVLHTVGSAAEARQRVADGVDVIVAQGAEAGGHVWGQVSTMALVPAVADAIGHWFTGRALDGLNLNFRTPDDLQRFVSDVVPILRERGVVRSEYQASTLR